MRQNVACTDNVHETFFTLPNLCEHNYLLYL